MKFLTAQNLRTGEVLYRTRAGAWSPHLAEAAALEDEAANAALEVAKSEATIVTGAYLVEADGDGAPSKRVRMREDIRGRGPTIRPDLGKQAEIG